MTVQIRVDNNLRFFFSAKYLNGMTAQIRVDNNNG